MNLLDRIRLLLTRNPATRVAPTVNPKAYDGDELPGPGVPIVMGGAAAENPRLFDYEYNSNANFQPRTEYNYLPTFFHLHAFYETCPEARVAANYFIEQILAVPYEIIERKEYKGKVDPIKLDKFRRLVEVPDPTVNWGYEQWLRAMLQEMVITDAVTVYPLKSKGGDFLAWQLIDGQTIKPILGDKGGRPPAPDVAYVQYIHGRPYSAFAADELIYYPFRPRVWCAYGESRVEEIISVMALLSAHSTYTQLWFGSSNIPESIALLDPDQVKGMDEKRLAAYQLALDEIAGMTTGRRRLFQMPPYVKDVKPVKQFEFNKELPEWLVRILCVQFGTPATLFVSETNRSTAEEIGKTLVDKTFRRTLMGVKRFWDELLRAGGAGELEFVFRQPRDFSAEAVDGIIKLATAVTPSGLPLLTVEEARAELGITKETDGEPEGGDNDYPQEPPQDALTDLTPEAPQAALEAPSAPVAAADGVEAVTPVPVAKAGAPKPPINPKAIAHKMVAARARVAAKMLKEIRPALREEEARITRRAIEQARARGKTIE